MRPFQVKSFRSFLFPTRPSAASNVGKAKRGEGRIARAACVALEPLEGRILMTAVVVNSIADTNSAGSLTLRDAITMANASTSPTTITFDPTVFAAAQTIVLDGTQLLLSNTSEPTTITGPAAGVTLSGDDMSRVLYVDENVTAILDSVSIEAGNSGSAAGGGIENIGTLDFDDASLTGSTCGLGGGGINNAGTLDMSNVSISANVADDRGGGLEDYGGPGSTGNAVAKLTDVTISGNSSTNDIVSAGGGGIASDGDGPAGSTTLILRNVTVADNTSATTGGGILLGASNLNSRIIGVTVAGNSAAGDSGGLDVFSGAGVVVGNTIVAGNTITGSGSGPDVSGTVDSLGYNLVGEIDGSSGWISSDLTGTAADPLNADLGSLADNGGPTETLLPAANSPAIGAGSVALIPAGITTDQRGMPRTVNGGVDIGAVEVGSTIGTSPTSAVLRPSSVNVLAGQSVTYTATVSATNGGPSPTGTVKFEYNYSLSGAGSQIEPVINGVASFTISSSTLNYINMRAVYSGDSSYAVSTSNAYTVNSNTGPLTLSATRGTIPASIVAGSATRGVLDVAVTNPTASAIHQVETITMQLFDSKDATRNIGSIRRLLSIPAGQTRTYPVSVKLAGADDVLGQDQFLYNVVNSAGRESLGYGVFLNIAAPVVTLAATSAAVRPATIAINKTGSIVITVTDNGNIAATGPLEISLTPSSDGVAPVPGVTLMTATEHVNLKPGKSGKYTLHFKIPAVLVDGSYYPLATISLDGISTTAIASQQFVIG